MSSPVFKLSGAFAGGGVLNLEVGQKLKYQRNGIATLTSIFKSQGQPRSLPIPLYTPYPDQSTGGFVCDSSETESLPGGFWKTTVVWISLFVGPTSYTTFDSKVIQVPIDQAPNFVSEIGGTPSEPLNGAIFDANGKFIGFPSGSAYQGVVVAYINQDLQIIRGSGNFAVQPDPNLFCESVSNTIRGAVWEYEITYNLDINVSTGVPDT